MKFHVVNEDRILEPSGEFLWQVARTRQFDQQAKMLVDWVEEQTASDARIEYEDIDRLVSQHFPFSWLAH